MFLYGHIQKNRKNKQQKKIKSAALWSFPNLLTKRNKSLAAIVNVFAIFLYTILEKFLYTRAHFWSACSNLSSPNKFSLIIFLSSFIIKYFRPFSSKLSNEKIFF